MEPSAFIGSSIVLYIVAFIAVLIVGGYLIYRISPKRKQHIANKRDHNNKH